MYTSIMLCVWIVDMG